MSGRFTLSYHFYSVRSEKNHFDLFLETGSDSLLIQFSLPAAGFRRAEKDGRFEMKRGRDHRRKYLTYSGPIDNNRGRIRVLKTGLYRMKKDPARLDRIKINYHKSKGFTLIR